MSESVYPNQIQEPVSVDDNAGSLTVDVGTALPAGNANIGDVDIASIAAGNNNIGDVDIASIAAGNNNIGDVDIASVPAPLSTTGGGTEATAHRVTIASDSTGVLTVTQATAANLNARVVGFQSHDGVGSAVNPVAMGAYASAAAPTDVSNDTDVVRAWALRNGAQVVNLASGGTLLVGGNGTAATALRVTVASDSTGTLAVTNAGTFAVQDSEKLADNAGFTDTVTKVMPTGYIFDEVAGTALTENDIGAARMDSKRAQVAVIEDETTRGRRTTVTAANALKVDGSAVTQPVSGTVTANQGTAGTAWEVVGDVAADVGVPGNPVAIGGRASTAVPTAMSNDGDSVYAWLNRNGAQVVFNGPHVGLMGSPWTLSAKTAQYTTTQTSTVLQAGGASEKLVVTYLQIQVGGTTAGTLQVYFGTGAYSRGTSLALFDGEFAPSATLKPGFVSTGPWISSTNGDDVLVTTSAAINTLTITIWYYIVT